MSNAQPKNSSLSKAALRLAVYGTLLAVGIALCPAVRCVYNPLQESDLTGPCTSTADTVILPRNVRTYALEQAAEGYYNTGRIPEAIAAGERLAAIDPKHNSFLMTVYSFEGVVAFDAKNYDSAIVNFTKALQYDATVASVRARRAGAYAGKGDFSAAIADYDDVLKARPSNGAAYEARGDAYRSLEQYDNAIRDYAAALEINPRSRSALAGIADLAEKQKPPP